MPRVVPRRDYTAGFKLKYKMALLHRDTLTVRERDLCPVENNAEMLNFKR
jgi:hypothetical protein